MDGFIPKNGDKALTQLVFVCPEDAADSRLDQALAKLLPDRSRAFVKKLIDSGLICVNGETAKAARKVKGGEQVVVAIPEAEPLIARPEDIPLEVLFEDDDIIVINKQPRLVAHPSAGHREGTLVNALLYHFGESLSGIGGVLRPGIVHRLDKDTSGCLVAAKNDIAHRNLITQFMDRAVSKVYLAITDGVPRPIAGKVEEKIGRNPKNRLLHAVLKSGGRHSLTYYKTLENYGAVALVECDLKTGRTHQARVHLAYRGAPVLCDRDYGRQERFTNRDLEKAALLFRTGSAAGYKPDAQPITTLLARQALHAWKLTFRHPRDGRELAFAAPLPADMLSILEPLRCIKAEMR